MAKLGKHKHGKGCLYINKLDDVDRGVLRKLVEYSVARAAQARYVAPPNSKASHIGDAPSPRSAANAARAFNVPPIGHDVPLRHHENPWENRRETLD